MKPYFAWVPFKYGGFMVKLFSNDKGAYFMTQEEFLKKAEIWVKKDRSTWTHITILAYFCLRYKDRNGVNFRFARWSGAPAKSKESRDFSRLIKMFMPEDSSSLSKEEKSALKSKAISKAYNYVNWVFDYKFRTADKSVTGTGIFLNHNILNHFERMWFAHQTKKKDESSYRSFVNWIENNFPRFMQNYDFQDKKDLKLILEFINSNNFGRETEEYAIFLKSKTFKL